VCISEKAKILLLMLTLRIPVTSGSYRSNTQPKIEVFQDSLLQSRLSCQRFTFLSTVHKPEHDVLYGSRNKFVWNWEIIVEKQRCQVQKVYDKIKC